MCFPQEYVRVCVYTATVSLSVFILSLSVLLCVRVCVLALSKHLCLFVCTYLSLFVFIYLFPFHSFSRVYMYVFSSLFFYPRKSVLPTSLYVYSSESLSLSLNVFVCAERLSFSCLNLNPKKMV